MVRVMILAVEINQGTTPSYKSCLSMVKTASQSSLG